MLFDPLEKQLYLPALLVNIGNHLCRYVEVVGQKHQAFVSYFVNIADSTQLFRVSFSRFLRFQRNNLISPYTCILVFWLRVYHLAAALYNRLLDVSGYVRTRGFDKIQQHQMVLSALAARKDKRITREDVADLCKITPAQAYHLLKKKTKDDGLELHGSGRGSYYTLKTRN